MNMKWLYRLIPILAIITLAIPRAPIQAMTTWADTDYPYRFKVTVESDYVDVDEEFPFVIDDAPEHFWDNVQEDGADILVCAEDKTKLYSELATWSYLFHDIELWVKGELSSTVDSVFYVYYGVDIEWADNDYTGITGSTPAQSVWDANFVFVSHMNDQEGGTKIYDSTSNANHGTKGAGAAAPTEVDGLVGKAQEFGGQSDSTCWIEITGLSYNFTSLTCEILCNSNDVLSSLIRAVGGNHFLFHYVGAAAFYLTASDGAMSGYLGWDVQPPLEQDNYLVATWDTATMKLYQQGIKQTTELAFAKPQLQTITTIALGRYFNSGIQTFDGLISEARISSTARGAGWISTTNNSMQESGFTVTGDYSVYPCVATNFNYSNLISQQNYAAVDLSWDYCADEIEYTVVRSETWYPLDPLDGEVRYSGSLLGFTDSFTPGENTYYYSIFSTTDMGTNASYSTLLVNMPMTPVEVGGNMMWVIIPIVIAGGIVIFAVRANIHMGQGKIKPDAVMRGIAIGLVALVAILAMLGVL